MLILKLNPAVTSSSRRLLCSSIKFHQQKIINNNRQLFQINNNSYFSQSTSSSLFTRSSLLSRNIHTSALASIELSSKQLNNNNPQGAADPYAPGISKVPTNALYKIFIAETLIFSVFGFFDNFIMMVFGDRIDCFFGDYITHPMVAAAFGNWMSDLFGLGTSERFETYLDKVFPAPPLNSQQMHSKQFHNWKYFGRFWGITVGCLIGAIAAYPLIEDAEMYQRNQASDLDDTASQKQHERNMEVKAGSIEVINESKVIEEGDKENKSESINTEK